VLGADYHTLARIEAPGQTTQFAFSTDSRETRIELARRGQARVASGASCCSASSTS
jgi:hypothetical protein